MKIGFLDSGIGGLTVMATAIQMLPAQDYLFMADNLHVPYGTKSKEEVRAYILEAVETMVGEGMDALVVACNTATSIAVAELRTMYSFPIVGMEPAVKPAVEMNRKTGKRVLVFATPLTLQQPKYYALVSRVDDEGIVDSLPLPELVHYCEELQFDKSIMSDYFRSKLADYDLDRYGMIVLGCTHYPFYKGLLREILPPHIQIIDGNVGTVKRLMALLSRVGMVGGVRSGSVRFMCTGNDAAYIEKIRTAFELISESNIQNEETMKE
ncbi:glutamate racemase [Paenibacillus sp. BIHB 4019]|uniref:Glutamate racemase n=1 Tax=Paenibacillus sp. BIHB 4019 TaxID=1870819 RepID=A0A1B2DMW9_9BACL|nr:glutamate racemase [Paenibacillus sp. BIHB 4019]ANY69060.1 glutamate racemase [Paenibacillus sp. BIHB 4019]